MVIVEDLSDVPTLHGEDDVSSYDDDDSLTPSMVFDQIMGPTVLLPSHEHPFYIYGSSDAHCQGCPERRDRAFFGYSCHTCDLTVHKECAESSLEINHPSHQRHPLTLRHGLPLAAADDKCRLCGEKLEKLVYHCSICDFSIDLYCARNPLELVVHFPKGHEHILTLMPRLIRFTCNACGLESDRSPYVCPQCDFMIHEDCIYLPRVISIIRHRHRISRTYFPGSGDWTCGVCRRRVDGRYGAYCCSICPDYAVHSKCATRSDVWDGRELEDEPEEDDECEEPFWVVSDGVINHFSHREHDLRLEDGLTNIQGGEHTRCRACVRPVYSNSFYSCMHCDDFVLHETCANLPRKQRHVLHNHQLTLYHDDGIVMDFPSTHEVFLCSACDRLCSGFRYECCNITLDVRCGSISEPFFYECHPHPLFQTSIGSKICVVCKEESAYVLSCMDCDFVLDFKCATLPNRVRYKYDIKPLSLCYDGDKDVTGSYWCEICEGEMDQKVMFYTCESYGSTIHIHCVLGDFRYVKPQLHFKFNGKKWKVALNGINRPGCYKCGFRCKGPFVAVRVDYVNGVVCSLSCLWKGDTFEFPRIID